MPAAKATVVVHSEAVVRESDGRYLLLVETHVGRFKPRHSPLTIQLIDPRLRR